MREEGRFAAGTPPVVSSVTVLFAALGVSVVTAVSVYTLSASVLGGILLVVSLLRGSRGVFTLGAGSLFAAVVLAGLLGVAPIYLLAAALLVVVAWNVGHNGFSLADEVGRGASTARVELVHAVSSVVVLAVGASTGYGVYLTVVGGQPVLALAALLVGAVALLVALQDRADPADNSA